MLDLLVKWIVEEQFGRVFVNIRMRELKKKNERISDNFTI